MVRTCAVYGCLSSSRYDKERTFFRFPKDRTRCRKWIQACGRPELLTKTSETLYKSYLICDLHFQASDRLAKNLKCFTIPTLNLPLEDNQLPEKSTQTEDVTPQKELPKAVDAETDLSSIYPLPTPSTSKAAQKIEELKIESKKRNISENEPKCSTSRQEVCDHNSRGNGYDTASSATLSGDTIEQSQLPQDRLDMFFLNISDTVKKFSPQLQEVAVNKTLDLVSEFEGIIASSQISSASETYEGTTATLEAVFVKVEHDIAIENT